MTITHSKVSSVPDSSNTDLVRPSDWNHAHDIAGFTSTVAGTGPQAGTGYAYHHMHITSDNLALNGPSGPGKVDGLLVQHNFGDSSTLGGRQTIYGVLVQDAVTSVTNYDRNYVAGVFQVISATGDGGGLGTELGAYFGGNSYARLTSGATFVANLTSHEFNTNVQTGASVKYKSGLQIHGIDDVQGSTYDTMLGLSNTGGATVGWKDGILIGPMAGQHPIAAGGTLFATVGSSTVTNGIDISSYTFTGSIFKGPNFNVSTSALSLTAASHGIEIGATGSSNTPFIDFHTSGNNIDYDGRLIASGGNGSTGNASLNMIFAGGIIFTNGTGLRTNSNAGNTLLLQAYDVDGGSPTTFITLTANNTPTCAGVFTSLTANTDGGFAFINQSNGAAAGVGTLTNAPKAGNPDAWIPTSYNGTAGWIPWWHA